MATIRSRGFREGRFRGEIRQRPYVRRALGWTNVRVARDSPEARDDGPTVNEAELLCQVQKPVREGASPA